MTDSMVRANAGTAQVRYRLLEPVFQPVRNSLDVGTACFLPVQSVIVFGEFFYARGTDRLLPGTVTTCG